MIKKDASLTAVLTTFLLVYALLAIAWLAFYFAAKPVAVFTLVVFLPALFFSLLAYAIPVLSFLSGLSSWFSCWIAIFLGLPLVFAVVAVFSVAGAGSDYMGVPVPWPTALKLRSQDVSLMAFKREVLTQMPLYLAGLLFGVVGRSFWNRRASLGTADSNY